MCLYVAYLATVSLTGESKYSCTHDLYVVIVDCMHLHCHRDQVTLRYAQS